MMRKDQFFATFLRAGVGVCLLAGTTTLLGITQYRDINLKFTKNLNELRPSIDVPVIDSLESVAIPTKILKSRVTKSVKDNRIENLHIKVPANRKDMASFAASIARHNKSAKLFDYFSEKFQASNEKTSVDNMKSIAIDPSAFSLMLPSKVGKALAKGHHRVEIISKALRNDIAKRDELLKQVRDFIPQANRQNVIAKINDGENLLVEKDLLPYFARKMAKQFISYKGPNCFHAALAFQGVDFSKSKFINVKEEDGYHSIMINYDELWRAINASFYEVNPAVSPLKYGDMIVFFDTPQSPEFINFRWIRHASTYLFGSYTFSKGSKSPDTPYTIKTLDEEWKTWQNLSQNLGVKVYRRTDKQVPKVPPVDLTDWLY
jgi:hypothetical protein